MDQGHEFANGFVLIGKLFECKYPHSMLCILRDIKDPTLSVRLGLLSNVKSIRYLLSLCISNE